MKIIKNQEIPSMSHVEPEEYEMNHTDKLVGVFTEPGATFEKMAKFPAKIADWLIPVFVLIVVSILSIIVMFTNPSVKLEMKQEQEKQIQKMVDEGTLTQEQADQQLSTYENFMGGPFFYVTTSITTLFGIFIVFFIVAGVFYLFAKLILQGEGNYKDAMVAYGLPFYIAIIQAIIVLILIFVLGKTVKSTSVVEFINIDKQSIVHFLLSKLDVLSIWFYVVVGIGFSKMFKSNDTKKYVFLIIGLWLGFGLIFFFLAKYVPFLQRFIV